MPADRLLTKDSQKVSLERHKRGHLLLPVPRHVVGRHQPAQAVTENARRGFVGHFEICYDGPPSAPKVMQGPSGNARCLVEFVLWPGERRHGLVPVDCEDPIGANKSRQRLEQSCGQRGQGHHMYSPDLVPGGRDHEQVIVAVEAG
jgi:hypothetical protein